MAAPAQKIGKYNVVETIGRGGMGVVVKAMDPSLGRVVAIKMMTAGATGEEFLKRFYREAQSTGNLHHPNIVTVHELGDQDGTPYLVMEFLEGESLDAIINARREIPLLEKLNVLVQVCTGLQYAHERGVIHRDIKPANVMVMKGGNIKIVDFGIARMGNDRLTLPGQVMGSIYYMSPEQIHGSAVDARTDIFSTGVMLYQLLTFALPFQAKDTASTLLKIIQDPPPPLSQQLQDYPPELDDILERALAKDPDERYRSADDFAFDLMRVQAQLKRNLVDLEVQEAEGLIQNGDFSGARAVLLRALKIDPQNRKANDAIRNVDQSIQRGRKHEQAKELAKQAESALEQQQFEQALRYIDRALALDDGEELQAVRRRVEATKIRTDALREGFRKLQAARAVGNLDAAMEAVELVLAIDADNAAANSALAEIEIEAAQREQQRKVQTFVREARKQISSRKFTDALEMLKRAEELDPGAPNLLELIELAAAGREQEQRKKQVAKFTAEIQNALNRDDFANACTLADEALAQFPGESVLLKLKDMAERQRLARERRSWVEGQMAAARKSLDAGDVAQALAMLEAAAQRYPTDPALQSFLLLVRETAAQQKLESRKTEVRHKAKQALSRRAYEEAITVLHAGKQELRTDDFDDLIQFAQDELDSYSHQLKVDAAASQAQSLIDIQEYAEAIEFLERTLAELPDEELRLMLAEVRRRNEEADLGVTEAAEAAKQLTAEERTAEAIDLLESQPATLREHPRIREAMENARKKHGWLQAIAAEQEKIRQALAQNNIDSAEALLASAAREFGDRAEFASLRETVHAQRVSTNLAAVRKAMREAALLSKFGSFSTALEKLESVTAAARYLPPDERAAYVQALADANEACGVRAQVQLEEREQTRQDEVEQQPSAATSQDGPTIQQVWGATGTDATVVAQPAPAVLHSVQAESASTAPKLSQISHAPVSNEASVASASRPQLLPSPADEQEPAAVGDKQRAVVESPARQPQRRWIFATAAGIGIVAIATIGWLTMGRSSPTPASDATPGLITRAVSSTPERVLIEVGDEVCRTPHCRIALPPGEYKLKAKLPSGVTVERNLKLEPATPAVIELDLNGGR